MVALRYVPLACGEPVDLEPRAFWRAAVTVRRKTAERYARAFLLAMAMAPHSSVGCFLLVTDRSGLVAMRGRWRDPSITVGY